MATLTPFVTDDVLEKASINLLCDAIHVAQFRVVVEVTKGDKEVALRWLGFAIKCREIVVARHEKEVQSEREKKERQSHLRMIRELEEEYDHLYDADKDLSEYSMLKRFLVGNAQDRGFPVKESLWPEGWNYVRYREETNKYTARTGKVVPVKGNRRERRNGGRNRRVN